MKTLKRILSSLLVIAVLFTLLSPVRAAEGEPLALSMTADRTEVPAGETVSITVRADRDIITLGSGMTIYYDEHVLEPDLGVSAAEAPFRIDGPLQVNGRTALRISFLPGPDRVCVSASEPLAELSFRALAAAEQTGITLGAAYFYDETRSEIPVTLPGELHLTVKPSEVTIPAEGIRLDKKELTMEEGETEVLTATVEPATASDPAVLWTSSDESVARVTDGTVKAISAGQATITATSRDGGFTAACIVTVKVPDAGYTVQMPEDTGAVLGGTVRIPVLISNRDGRTGYNAFDISFAYDPEVLELVSMNLPGVTVSTSRGKVNVLGYGEDRPSGSVPFTLEFRTLKPETSEIRITAARVDNSGNAVVKNAALATVTDDRTEVAVNGYPVTLPEGFTGGNTALPGADYTFAAPDDFYDYTVTATVGGREVEVCENEDGSYVIPAEQVTGEIIIKARKTGKTFRVKLGTDMTGEATARYGSDYEAVIDRDEDYRYTVTVTIGGENYTGYRVSGDTYTIPGTDITGNIVFKVVKKRIQKPADQETRHEVTFTGSGAGAAQGNPTSAADGKAYSFTLKKQAGCTYQVSYKMGGKPGGTLLPDADGTYTVPKVTAPLEIIVEKSMDIQISVQEFLTLDQKTVYLILANGSLDSGDVLTYDGNVMYYSDSYGAWAWLVITAEELDEGKIEPMVRLASQTKRRLKNAGADVDLSGRADWNDVQLVLDLYNAEYDSFDTVSMVTFLSADVNRDKKLDVLDAACAAREVRNT